MRKKMLVYSVLNNPTTKHQPQPKQKTQHIKQNSIEPIEQIKQIEQI